MLRIGTALGGSLLARPDKALAAEETAGRLGTPLGPYGERSPFEKAVWWRRDSATPETGSSFTPLQDSVGIMTPSSLHYERHHSGIPRDRPRETPVGDLWNGRAAAILHRGRDPATEWPEFTPCRY
jgi:hypothetical protein